MKKTLRDLLDEELIEEFTSTPEQIENEMNLAKSDIKSTKLMIPDVHLAGWAHNASYNAILQASRALMFNRGYRTKRDSGQQHVTVIQFIEVEYSKEFPSVVLKAFSKARGRRHRSLYDVAGTITQNQAQFLLINAESFVSIVEGILKDSK